MHSNWTSLRLLHVIPILFSFRCTQESVFFLQRIYVSTFGIVLSVRVYPSTKVLCQYGRRLTPHRSLKKFPTQKVAQKKKNENKNRKRPYGLSRKEMPYYEDIVSGRKPIETARRLGVTLEEVQDRIMSIERKVNDWQRRRTLRDQQLRETTIR